MTPSRTGFALAFLTLPILPSSAVAAEEPGLLLAGDFQEATNLADYWVSEKLDGIRAYWNGSALITRNGNHIHAPGWFTEVLPTTSLDGELWIGRGQFERLLSTVSKDTPIDGEWQQVKYKVFDLPGHLGNFDDRKLALDALLEAVNARHVQAVEQFKVQNRAALDEQLATITAKGGEGLMLHRGRSLYQAQRSDDLQKVKLAQDAEARVIDYLPGKGKYDGMMGALLVEAEDGVRFRIGSGFTVEERQQPPAIGSTITFRYRGKTSNDIPRFATFLRVKEQI